MDLFNTKMAAEYLGLSAPYIKNLIKTGRLKATKLGSNYIMTKDDLEAFKQYRANNLQGDHFKVDPTTGKRMYELRREQEQMHAPR